MGMPKVKLALGTSITEQLCYEFQLNLGKIESAQIVFTIANQQVNVYYFSKNCKSQVSVLI